MVDVNEKDSKKDTPVSIDDMSLIYRIHWFRTFFIITNTLLYLFGNLTTKQQSKTHWFSFVYSIFTAFGITAGYHRLWSHSSYKATTPLKIFLAIAASTAAQGSIYWWCRDHRIHHRYTDTPRDPYNAKSGFFFSHVGWMLLKRDRSRLGYVDTSDLLADKVVMWQHKYYNFVTVLFGFILPTVVCGLGWGDWRGGFFVAVVGRIFLTHHFTFCVNSLAHTIGTSTYDDSQSSKDSFITAILTFGEGYHNFHHEFPNDYRNAIRFYQYDPTKWFIWACSIVGLAYDLKTFPKNEIEKGYVEMRLKEIAKAQSKLDYGTPLDKLPSFTIEEFEAQVIKLDKKWIVIQSVIYDVSSFFREHPGGEPLIRGGIGKDMTDAFTGGVYKHHSAAHNLLSQLRVGTISA